MLFEYIPKGSCIFLIASRIQLRCSICNIIALLAIYTCIYILVNLRYDFFRNRYALNAFSVNVCLKYLRACNVLVRNSVQLLSNHGCLFYLIFRLTYSVRPKLCSSLICRVLHLPHYDLLN